MPSDAERLAGVGAAVAAVGITTAASVYASRPGPKRWTRWLVLGGAAAAYGAYSLATWLEDQKNATAHGGDGDARDVDAAREKPAEDPDGGIGASSEISADPDPPARRSQMDQLLDAVAGGYDDDDDDLDAAFDRAAKTVASTNRKLTNDQKLRVYALFKQSTVGANDTRKPRLLEGMAKHAKWSAWNELGDMPRDDAKAARDEAMAALAEAREELDALERAKRAEDEAMVEVMKMMDERRARDDDARRRRLDETRAAIEFEFDARAIFREHRTSLELSDEIYERSKGLEGVGPWREFDLGDVPDDLVETIARVVDARRENDAIRDELLAKGADANYAAFRDELERMRASDRPESDV